MTPPPNPRAATAFRTISWAALALPVAVGGAVLLGWIWGVPDLARLAAKGAPMKPLPALAFLLAGASVGLCQAGTALRWRGPFARTCAGAVLLLGLLSLAEFGLGWDLSGGLPLFRRGGAALGPAAVEFWTSFNFVLLGLALLGRNCGSRRGQPASQALLFAVAGIALLGLAQDCFATIPTPPLLDFSLSAWTAGLFLVIVAGLLGGQPDRGALALVLGASDGGRLTRRLLPAAVAGPMLSAVLLEFLLRRGALHPGEGTAIFAVLAVLVSGALILLNARALNRWGRERRQAAARLQRLNRTLRMLSEANQLVVRAGREDQLLPQFCQAVVAEGGYRMAWIGFAERDAARTVRPAAQAGFAEGYLEQARVTWTDGPRGRGPSGTAIRTGQPCVFQNILSDPRFAPWRAEAAARGYAAVAAFPLRDGAETLGALNFYAAEADAFDADELRLLDELAGDLAFGIVTLRNQERQRQTEAALRESQALLEQAQAVAHLGSWVSAPGPTGTLNWSAEVYRIFGLGEGEFDGTVEGFRARVHPEDRAAVEAASRAALERGEPYALDHRIVRPDGTVRWVQERAEVIRDAEGRPLRMLGVVQDITERRQAEEALRHERRLLRTVIDHLPDSIYTKDLQGRKTLANRVEFEYLGLGSEAEALGKTDFECYPAALAAATTADDQQVLQTGQPIRNREELIISPDGRQRWLLTSKLPLRDEYGQIIGLVGIGHDITARKQAEEALANERKLLRTLVDHLPVSVYLKDTAGRITLTNPTNLLWFNATSETEILGKTDFDFFPPEQARGFYADEQNLLKSGQPLLNHEEEVTPPNGSTRWNLVSKVPLFDAAGRATGLAGIGLDITERKRMEEALRRSEELLAETGRLARVGGWEFDPATGQGTWTDEVARIHDLEPGSATSVEFGLSFYTGESRAIIEAAVRKVVELGEPYDLDLEIQTAKGRHKWVRTIGRPILQNGQVVKVRGSLQDITERKQAEERLRLQSSALEAAANAMLITDRAGNIEWVNPAFTRLTGYAWAEVLGRNPRALKSGLHDAAFYAELWRTILAGRVWQGEMVNKRKDGTLYSEELTITPVRDKAGEVSHFIAIKQDITDRKRAEETLAHERNLLRTLINHLPCFIYVKDAQNRYLLSNIANARLLGLASPEDTLGKTDRDFFPAELAAEYWANERKVLETGRAQIEMEERIVSKPGEQRWQATTQVPLRDSQGVIIGLVGIGRDITERKRAEEEIHKLNAELEARVLQRTAALEAANKELEAFSYSVSHDLRAPLRAIDGYARILTEDYQARLDADGQRVVGVICAEARRMGQLIDDLLHFSRLGRQEIRKIAVDMTALAASVFQELTALEPKRTVQWALAPLPPAWGDAALLRQVWANLLSNALKFTQHRDRPVITAGSRPEGGQMIYFVQDNGAGFDMRFAPKLFGVFQRLHRNDEFPGTGVGLALVQRIILRHGGRVWAEAKVNEGAAFYFSLPNQPIPT